MRAFLVVALIGCVGGATQMTSNSVCLRAEAPQIAARKYTVTLTSTDQQGNVGSTDLVIEVPHDNRGHCLKFANAGRGL